MKIKYYFSIAMAALVMTNCSQEEELQDIQQRGDVHTLTATIEGSSRSAVTDGGVFSWTSDDAISVWDGDSYEKYTYVSGNNFNGSANQISGYAIYPNGSHPNYSGSGLPQVNLSSTYTYGSTNAIMLAKVQGSSYNLSFSHLGGLMRFTIKNIPSNATSFTFTANSGITGDFQVETQNDGTNVIKATTSNNNQSVTISFSNSQLSNGTGTFYVPLPVGTYTGFTIAVDNCSYTSQATNTIKRRTLLLMPTFTCNGTQLTKGDNAFKLENTVQDMNVSGDETLVIETPNSNDANAQLNLNYAPTDNATLNISDGQTGDSQDSKAKVVVDVKNNNTVAELNIDAPTLTVELASGTYETITAKTAKQTLIIKSGVTVENLKVIGGKVEIEKGANVKKQTELRVLTFEDGTEGFEPYECEFYYAMNYTEEYKTIEKWSDYIPRDGQYGNGHGAYEWYDEGNTELAFVKPEIESWWGISGHAGISDYVGTDEDIAKFGDDNMMFMIDLQAYNVTGGANGSKNFCSQYGYLDPEEYATQYSPSGVLPGIQFMDEEPRVIDHMYVTNTTYAYGIITRGECDFGGSYEYTDESTFKIIAYGYDSFEDTEPTTTEFYLLNTGKRIVTDWTKWDLSVLGKVVRVEFNLVACYEGYGRYGLVIPAYFAYDDVAVQFEK